MDARLFTTIRIVVAHQRQQMKLEVVGSDSRKSVDQIASEDGISVWNCHSILHELLNMRRVCNISPTSEKEGTKTSIFGDLIDMADKDNKFPNNINWGDETWCFLYDRQAKR